MKRAPPRNRKVLQRLMGDIRALTDRETAALERLDIEELESVQERKALLTEACARYWKHSDARARRHPVLTKMLKELLEASRRNHALSAKIIEELINSGFANAAASQRLNAVRGSYAPALDSPQKLKTRG